ncbi:MAG: hypothetical protein PHG81_11015 [Aliarcobacter sp.]|nr:hypothetical protein [Aliarcobacter sp.]
MLNFANDAIGSTQIFTQKNSLEKNIFTDTNELENISRLIAVIKEKIDITTQGYQIVEKLFKENSRKKYELNQKISQKKKEIEKILADLTQLKKIYDDYNLKYENVEELSIIDNKSEPIFRRELNNIENLLIKFSEYNLFKKNYKQIHQVEIINEKISSEGDNKLDLKEKLEIINQNLNEILSRRDEKNRLIVLKENAFRKLKLKEHELNSYENQLTILITQEKQLIPINYRRSLAEDMIKINGTIDE